MAELKAKPPPPTEILSVTKRPAGAEEPTSPNGELVTPPPVEPVPEPPPGAPPQEPTGQPFEFEEPPPGEPPPEEPPPEEDPQITEAKRKMHEVTQELARQKKLTDAILRQRELESMTPQAPGPVGPPPEFFETKPTPEELADPNFFERYTTRRIQQENFRQAQGEMVRDMRDFVDQNKDWQEFYPTMLEIKNEDPYAYQSPGSIRSLYKRAKERVDHQNLQAKLQEIQSQGVQSGANIQATKANRPFATPRSRGAAGVPQGKTKMPVDFASWSTSKQEEWLKQSGLWHDDNY